MPRRHSSVQRPKSGARPGGRADARPSAKASAKAGPSQRQLRVGELLRHALSEILRRGEVRDADLAGVSVTVTQVIPSPDMRHATVFCEPLGGKNVVAVIAALNRHKGFLRGEMGRMIAIKFTPELRFVEDTSFAEAEKIETLLKSARVAKDLSQAAGEESEGDDGA
jgi:ribosome-binding factor A